MIMACKDMKMCEEVRDQIRETTFNKNVHCMKCDLTSLQSIKEFVDEFNQSKFHCLFQVDSIHLSFEKRFILI